MRSLTRAGLALALLTTAGFGLAASDRQAVPFIDDDYERALSEARARDVPLFIETWAPW